MEAVLARVAGKLSDDERGGYGPVADRSRESQDLFPLRSDQKGYPVKL